MPRLSAFITEHSDEILEGCEAFARKIPTATTLDIAALRDHAKAMLDVIAADLESPQTEAQRGRTARRLSDVQPEGEPTAATEYGLARAQGGFSVESTFSEFRALRASVVTLWLKQQRELGATEIEEMRRFDEALDQAIAESLARFTKEIDSARERFLAVLGHDLRTPLAAILTSGRYMLEESELSERDRILLSGMERSGLRMSHLVDDLLVLALTRFGESIPVRRSRVDLGAVVREAADEVGAAVPSARIEVETKGELLGEWDRMRLEQAVANVLSNALQYGTPGKPVRVAASGEEKEVAITVANEGRGIPPDQISTLFDDAKGKRGEPADRRHLGLGLYIVDKIVAAHGGSIDVHSSADQGTTFRITIPRHADHT